MYIYIHIDLHVNVNCTPRWMVLLGLPGSHSCQVQAESLVIAGSSSQSMLVGACNSLNGFWYFSVVGAGLKKLSTFPVWGLQG